MLIENWKSAWRMLSVQLQVVWGTACAAFAAFPADRQESFLGLFGVGAGGAAAASFVAQVAAALAAATVAARVTRQPSLHRDDATEEKRP